MGNVSTTKSRISQRLSLSQKKKSSDRPRPRTNSKLYLPSIDMRKFLDFCESKHAGENVRFYMAVEEYEKACALDDQSKMKELGEQIVVNYVSDKSPNQINVKDEDRKGLLDAYSSGEFTKDTFRQSKIQIVSDLMDGLLPAYEESCT